MRAQSREYSPDGKGFERRTAGNLHFLRGLREKAVADTKSSVKSLPAFTDRCAEHFLATLLKQIPGGRQENRYPGIGSKCFKISSPTLMGTRGRVCQAARLGSGCGVTYTTVGRDHALTTWLTTCFGMKTASEADARCSQCHGPLGADGSCVACLLRGGLSERLSNNGVLRGV